MTRLNQLFELSERLLTRDLGKSKRSLYFQIDWTARLIFIVGFRGSGKTTLLLQKLQNLEAGKTLYLTADSILVNSLFDLAKEFSDQGGKYLAIDEIHKYPNWKQEIKNIYDLLPDLQIFASGSSSISITKGQFDLSRRSVLYQLFGLSFREFLNFKHGLDLPTTSYSKILQNPIETSRNYLEIFTKNQLKVLVEFKEYLQTGYYPYFLEGTASYTTKLRNSINKMIYEDILTSFNLKPSSTIYFKKLIQLVATSHPFTPNIESLSSSLAISKETVYNYLEYLQETGLMTGLQNANKGLKSVRKPAKLFLENTNLYYVLADNPEIGTVRETFFVNQLKSAGISLFLNKKVDFQEAQNLFEIGGKNKNKGKYPSNTNLVLDQETAGFGIVPLWLFGMMR